MRRVAACCLLLVACAGDPTQLVVVVDSDMTVPEELDAVSLEVTAPDGVVQSAHAALGVGEDLPRTLVLLHGGGALGPVRVYARGLRAGVSVVERRASVAFVPGQTLMLRIELLRECVGRVCAAGRTCAAGGCRPEAVDPSELRPWSGTPGPLPNTDAGAPDADVADASPDVCSPSPEICNDLDDDCDGEVDEGFDLGAEPANCGACGVVCADALHATGSCARGACELRCEPGFVDCNLNPADGCEADLTSASSCGACGVSCDLAFASEVCVASVCDVGSCAPGHADCDGVRGNGCESSTSALGSCGSCSLACPLDPPHAASACVSGSCALRCDAGFADCDGDAANGCEADLSSAVSCGSCAVGCIAPTAACVPAGLSFACGSACPGGLTDCGGSCADLDLDPGHCGACGTVCAAPAHAAAVCAVGACGFVCDPGFADCNGLPVDGCEADLSTLSNCGGCGSVCALPQATSTCGASGCAIAACDPGFGDCNGLAMDGCELPLGNAAACGACGDVCAGATPDCVAGSCVPALDPVVELSLGKEHACARRASGGVECWGRNNKGQLGDGSFNNRRTPAPIPGLTASAISMGRFHGCALDPGGRVLCWGDNGDGQLGDGGNTERAVPMAVLLPGGASLTGATWVAAGRGHSCAVTPTGLYCWGRNNNGQLGDGTTTDRFFATAVAWPGSAGAPVSVSAGDGSTCVVDDRARVYCFGDNGKGQLGDGTQTQRVLPTLVPALVDVAAVSVGASFACAARAGGAVDCWGENSDG
ncbi:MAG: hypothetical protein GXP55_13315, partial [Deltaproteobacteria bacterium]|nr:hypothetical protein [Deltaproteobacteria bacterium]